MGSKRVSPASKGSRRVSSASKGSKRKKATQTRVRPREVQGCVKKSHLMMVLKSLRKDRIKTETDKISRACSVHQYTAHQRSKVLSQSQNLLFALRNSFERHDWSTAARVVKFMLDFPRLSFYIYRSILPIVFNHPDTNGATIQKLLSEVMNLRTHSEQEAFLRHLFNLPSDLDVYCGAVDILKAKSLAHISDDELGDEETRELSN